MKSASGSKVVSPAVAALEGTWAAIARRHPELPPAAVVIASGTAGRKPASFVHGHYASLRWERAGERLSEVLVAGERLGYGPAAVLGTLLHEAAHALADVRGWKDTSRQGRYHNARYADAAAEVGLEVQQAWGLGYAVTTPTPATLERYIRELARLEVALTLHRRAEVTRAGAGSNRSSNLIAAECACPRRLRIARGTLELGAITCDVCGEEFAAANLKDGVG